MIASDGNAGTLVLGDNEIIPEWKEETISDDKPDDSLYVDAYRITTLNGVRRSAIVENLGVLKGTGSIKEYLMVRHGGVVSPGLSPGCMTVGTILELYGEYQFEAHDGTACSGYDQLKVGGIVRLTEESNEDNPNPKSGKLNVSLLDGYNLPTGTVMTIIDNQGNEAVKGTFEGLPEGATIKGPNGAVLKISYVGGDGNDVTLTVITAGTPDTGFGLLLNNPMVVLGATTVAAGAILVISRRTKLAAQRVRR